MKIGFTYDILSDYGFDKRNLKFADFTTEATVTHIKKALELCGYSVKLIGNLNKLYRQIVSNTLDCDMIFNIAEGVGSRNREGLIPALLDCCDIPYTGSDAYALSLTLNKLHTKIIAENLGIRTPYYVFIDKNTSYDEIEKLIDKFPYPAIVKPNREGSSMGVYLVESKQDCIEAIVKNIEDYKQGVLCEEYIDGLEITVPILGHLEGSFALGIASYSESYEIASTALYTTEQKYYDEVITYIPNLSKHIEETITNNALKIHKHLKCFDYNRVDFRLSSKQIPYMLEVNPLPSLSPEGSFEICARSKGLEYHEIIKSIVESAKKRYRVEVI